MKSTLRQKMVEDLQLLGYAKRTQHSYIRHTFARCVSWKITGTFLQRRLASYRCEIIFSTAKMIMAGARRRCASLIAGLRRKCQRKWRKWRKCHPLEVPVKHKIPFHSRFSTACPFHLSLIGSTSISIAERLLPSGSSSRGCSVTHLDPGCRRQRQPPPRYAAPSFRIIGTRKPFVPADCLFSQSGFPFGVPDPLGLVAGQPRFKQWGWGAAGFQSA